MGEVTLKLAILGSTGSIGRQTLDVVRSLPGNFRVTALSAGHNLPLLAQQAEEFHPQYVCYLPNEDRRKIPDFGAEFMPMEDMARLPAVDILVIATSGAAGLGATLSAVRAGKKVAIANKEPLVMAGDIITEEARRNKASILAIDSEHSAIWQCMAGEIEKPERIILTASGGPFRAFTPEQLKKVTARDALKHPTWNMGRKVTIDSATLMNKGFEVIEARWLFGVPIENISVIVHPQSVIHSMIEMADGSVKAQMACPDMRLPIQYALSHPGRFTNPSLPRLNWEQIKELTFEPPDTVKFPCLRLAIEAGKTGGTMPAVLCAADDVAVELFLNDRIGFTDIPAIVAGCMEEHKPITEPPIEVIIEVDAWARDRALALAKGGVV